MELAWEKVNWEVTAVRAFFRQLSHRHRGQCLHRRKELQCMFIKEFISLYETAVVVARYSGTVTQWTEHKRFRAAQQKLLSLTITSKMEPCSFITAKISLKKKKETLDNRIIIMPVTTMPFQWRIFTCNLLWNDVSINWKNVQHLILGWRIFLSEGELACHMLNHCPESRLQFGSEKATHVPIWDLAYIPVSFNSWVAGCINRYRRWKKILYTTFP